MDISIMLRTTLGRLPRAVPFLIAASVLVVVIPVQATEPWEKAVTLPVPFTRPIAQYLSLVAIVVGGLMLAFGKDESKRILAHIVLGIGMLIGAVNFLARLFPYASSLSQK